MKLRICHINNLEANYFVKANELLGKEVYLDNEQYYCVDVLNHKNYIRNFEPNYILLGIDKPYTLTWVDNQFVLEQ